MQGGGIAWDSSLHSSGPQGLILGVSRSLENQSLVLVEMTGFTGSLHEQRMRMNEKTFRV